MITIEQAKRAEANRQKTIAILSKIGIFKETDLKSNHSRLEHVGAHKDFIWSQNKHATALFYSKNKQ